MNSFYGNIKNVNRTQFNFDKTYNNRYEMEKNTSIDNVFIGRYVLIEYDSNKGFGLDTYLEVYIKNESFYIDESCTIRATAEYVHLDDVVKYLNGNVYIFYKCTGFNSSGSDASAIFQQITDLNSDTYTKNYSIDLSIYGDNTGYDSTVWQKIYTQNNGQEYIKIADLNTTTPKFSISADPPSVIPSPPHFGSNSTNINYDIHMQPSWGFRVKEAEDENYSDVDINHKALSYNKITDTIEEQLLDYKGNIYFNKAGFNPNIRSKVNKQDDINILPTGESGIEYNNHDVPFSKEPKKDIQEMSIVLPSFGNTISDIWDLIYGDEQQTNGSKNRNLDIAWDSKNGLRAVKKSDNGYIWNDNEVISTLAGCINSIHDLMGMNIKFNKPNENQLTSDSRNYIYYSNGKFYRTVPKYTYTAVTGFPSSSDIYGYEFDLSKDYYKVVSENGELIYDSMWNYNITHIPAGTILAFRNSQISYKYEELPSFADSYNTIHGIILRFNQMVEQNNEEIRDLNTLQGCINTLNDLIERNKNIDETIIRNIVNRLVYPEGATDEDVSIKLGELIDITLDSSQKIEDLYNPNSQKSIDYIIRNTSFDYEEKDIDISNGVTIDELISIIIKQQNILNNLIVYPTLFNLDAEYIQDSDQGTSIINLTVQEPIQLPLTGFATIRFIAPNDYVTTDILKIDGNIYTIKNMNGKDIRDGLWIRDSLVMLNLLIKVQDGNYIYEAYPAGGGGVSIPVFA